MVLDAVMGHEPVGQEPVTANSAMISIINNLRVNGFNNSKVGNTMVKDMDTSTPQSVEDLIHSELFLNMGTPDHLQFSIVRSNREWMEPLEHLGKTYQIHKHEIGSTVASDLRIYWMTAATNNGPSTDLLEIRPNTGNILNIDLEVIKLIFDDIPLPVVFRNQDSQRNSESRFIVYRNKAATMLIDSTI